jgi:aspartate/methionine/tyrosine aminotransferase
MVSRRSEQIDASGIRKVFDLAAQLKNPCNLSIGQPNFDVPEEVKRATIEAIQDGRNSYTQTQGIGELREALAQEFVDRGIPQESLFVTSAVSGGFLLALMATCDVGDEIVVPDPYFVFWKGLAQVQGVTPKFIDTYPDFRWTREKLEAAITPKTRAIVISSPANPTGVAASEEELRMIAEVAGEHDLWVIYDEIYRHFIYDSPHLDMSRYYAKTITLGGYSKSHSMTGWRVGYAAGPDEVIGQMLKLQQYSFVCAPTPAQWGALAAIDVSMERQVADYRAKRDYMVEQLSSQYNLASPDGAFYLFVEAPEGEKGSEFVMRALQDELMLVPGNVFSEQDTHFRISYAADQATLERGAEILQRLAVPVGV